MYLQKLLLTLCLIAVIASPTFAQDNPAPVEEGTIRYLVTHNWTKKLASLAYLSKQRKERAAYMYGNDSEWKEYSLLHFNSTQTHYLDSEERVNADEMGYSWRKETFWVRRDFEKGTMADALVLQGKTYLIEDSLRCQDWKILNDLKEVAGHLCMNASWVDTVKQQKIIAWFALDIPHQGGPERYCGLPGMILEIDVNDGAMNVSANRIESKKLTSELEPPKKAKGKKSSEADYQKALHKVVQESIKEEEPYFWRIRY